MKGLDCKDCKVHVLVCTNERPPGRSSCGPLGGQEFYLALKKRLKDSGLYGTHWVTRTGCLGFCNDVGTTLTIYREGESPQWLNEVTMQDLEQVWSEITRT